MQKDYLMGWVHKEICEALDQFYQDCLDGKNPRLMINLAPRHGKSQIVSRMFPAYLFGRNPVDAPRDFVCHCLCVRFVKSLETYKPEVFGAFYQSVALAEEERALEPQVV